jgi:hypothetical protein
MTKYLVLIYEDEARYAGATPEVFGQISQEHTDWMASVEQSGAKLLGGEALQSTGTATSVRGGSEVTDGPFVETKEHIGGFLIVKSPNLDSALEWAGRFARALTLPGQLDGLPVEVRPFQGEVES